MADSGKRLAAITMEQWVAWIGATLTAAIGMTAYAFSNFETKNHAAETVLMIQRDAEFRWTEAKSQLSRIEEGVKELQRDQRQLGRNPSGR